MLQIIGWVLCLMLFCKGCEIIANPAYRIPDVPDQLNGWSNTAAVLAIGGSMLFAFALYYQGTALNDIASASSYSATPDYSSMTPAEVEALADQAAKDAMGAAEAADAAADAAMGKR